MKQKLDRIELDCIAKKNGLFAKDLRYAGQRRKSNSNYYPDEETLQTLRVEGHSSFERAAQSAAIPRRSVQYR